MTQPDTPEGIIAYRLSELEKRLGRMEHKVDEQLTSIQATIGNLAFVRKDVYDEYRSRIDQRFSAIEERDASTRSIAMWALGTTLTVIALVGTLVGLLKVIAG